MDCSETVHVTDAFYSLLRSLFVKQGWFQTQLLMLVALWGAEMV